MKDIVARFEKLFLWLLGVLFLVIVAAIVMRFWVLDVPEGVLMPGYMLLIVGGFCLALSVIYFRVRYVLIRDINSVEDCVAERYRGDVLRKRRIADIGWGCLMGMVVLLSIFVFICDNL